MDQHQRYASGTCCTFMLMRIFCVLLALVACTLPAYAARFLKRPKYEVIGYIFSRSGGTLDGSIIAAKKMTRINYAFFALEDGVIVLTIIVNIRSWIEECQAWRPPGR